jgi:hypothetical protein
MNNILTLSRDEVTHQHIINSKESLDLIYMPGYIPSTTKWEEFISHCDYLEKNRDLTLPSPVKVIGALQMWDELFIAGYYAQKGNVFSQWNEVTSITDFLFGRENDGGCTLINFIGNQKTIPVHTDTRDSFLWQAIGSVEWRICDTDSEDSAYKVLIVNPGDLLFIPSGLAHTVYCLDPRAALSIFYDKKD